MSTTEDFLHPTAATFDQEVLQSDTPVVVDFWAPWCGPCRSFKPIVEAVARERAVQTAFVNVDEEQALAVRYGVQSIPAVKLFRNGELVGELTGAIPKPEFEAWLASNGA